TEAVPRVRVGIGRTPPAGADITGHVLGRFAPAERGAADRGIERAVTAVSSCLAEGLTAAMNKFNRRAGPAAANGGEC
ncbi:aminoacyl-tRNA hydrolase, partial [bacterium]|nr:aminoacyl-tRNA hydrolase [bacterium]